MDVVLEHVRSIHQGEWGRVLDAGTGQSSLEWVSSLDCEAWTAVTAEPARAEGLRRRLVVRPQDRLLVGCWTDPTLLAGERFDVVVADYLFGSVDRYAPWFQVGLVRRLAALTGEVLYVVGLEPYPEEPGLIQEIAALRDAVQLLRGRRPHREVPCEWLFERLREAGLEVEEPVRFENLYGPEFLEGELGAVETLLPQLGIKGLEARVQALRAQGRRLLRKGPIACSYDYLLVARLR